jgi:predicted phosphoribosyltransferase
MWRVFENREEAGRRLAEAMKDFPLRNPLVLAIPRGGVEVGVALAKGLGADLDVVLSRKLRSPFQPELALGAVSETGEVHLNRSLGAFIGNIDAMEEEREHELAEIERQKALYRAVRPRAEERGRSVILTDDGIATGSTMIAAIRTVRARSPHEIIVAVPVSSSDRLGEIRGLCDRVVCLQEPDEFFAVGQFYRDFSQAPDERVVALLREFGRLEGARALTRRG